MSLVEEAKQEVLEEQKEIVKTYVKFVLNEIDINESRIKAATENILELKANLTKVETNWAAVADEIKKDPFKQSVTGETINVTYKKNRLG